jgi:cell division protease FtsH
MSDRLYLIAYEKAQQRFIEGMTNPRHQVSPRLAEEIDNEVKAVIDGVHQVALAVLSCNRQLLKQLAQTLLDRESLEGTNCDLNLV